MNEYRDEPVGNAIRALSTPAASDNFNAWLDNTFASEGRHQSVLTRLRVPRLRVARSVLVAAVAALVVLTLVPIGGASLGQRAVDSVSSLWTTQESLDGAAKDARSVAGGAYYTDARVHDAANDVDLYLADAPQSVLDQLNAMHPGTYVIHNDAAHPLSELLRVQRSLRLGHLQTASGSLLMVTSYPTSDGHLKVGLTTTNRGDLQAAQSTLDSLEGSGIVEVYGGDQPMTSMGASGALGPQERSLAERNHR